MKTLNMTSVVPIVCALLLGVGASDLSAQGYQVVVNAANPVTSMRANEVSRMFQKRVTKWADGLTVSPVDLPERSPVRQAFTRAVHRRSVDAMKA